MPIYNEPGWVYNQPGRNYAGLINKDYNMGMSVVEISWGPGDTNLKTGRLLVVSFIKLKDTTDGMLASVAVGEKSAINEWTQWQVFGEVIPEQVPTLVRLDSGKSLVFYHTGTDPYNLKYRMIEKDGVVCDGIGKGAAEVGVLSNVTDKHFSITLHWASQVFYLISWDPNNGQLMYRHMHYDGNSFVNISNKVAVSSLTVRSGEKPSIGLQEQKPACFLDAQHNLCIAWWQDDLVKFNQFQGLS